MWRQRRSPWRVALRDPEVQNRSSCDPDGEILYSRISAKVVSDLYQSGSNLWAGVASRLELVLTYGRKRLNESVKPAQANGVRQAAHAPHDLSEIREFLSHHFPACREEPKIRSITPFFGSESSSHRPGALAIISPISRARRASFCASAFARADLKN